MYTKEIDDITFMKQCSFKTKAKAREVASCYKNQYRHARVLNAGDKKVWEVWLNHDSKDNRM